MSSWFVQMALYAIAVYVVLYGMWAIEEKAKK